MEILKTIGVAFIAGIVGYAIGFPLSMWAVNIFSTNTHDASLEATMTAAFVYGPCIALIAAITGAIIYSQWRSG